MFTENGGSSEAEIPADLTDDVSLLRDVTVENIAESDEVLMEKYLEEGSLSLEDLQFGLRKGVLSGELTPVMVCSALENKGGKAVLDAVEALLPSPLERPAFVDAAGAERAPDPDGPVACFVFKTLADPFAGQLSILRVLSGTINGDATLKNMRSEDTERLGSLLYLVGKNQTPCKEPVGPGAIVAVAKLKNTRTGDTLCDEKSALCPAHARIAAAVDHLRPGPQGKGRGRQGLRGHPAPAGRGHHPQAGTRRGKRRHSALRHGPAAYRAFRGKRPSAASRSTSCSRRPKCPIARQCAANARCRAATKKQSGGRGQFGDCWIEMEGLPRGSGYVFEDAIVGGVIPRQYIPAIDKGVQEAAARGFLAGCQVVDFRVKVYDGSYHTVDSSEMAFKVAGSLAFKKPWKASSPCCWNPLCC